MPVRIRLQRHGRRKRPFYHIVVADSRAPRDGKFIQKLGTYDPMTVPATIDIDHMAAIDWLNKGAQPSHTARAILRHKGVLYYKHLMRGVDKGALTQEEATEKYLSFIQSKDEAYANKLAEQQKKKEDFNAAISGEVPVIEEPVVEEAAPATEDAPATEQATEPAAPAAEEAPAADAEEASEEKEG